MEAHPPGDFLAENTSYERSDAVSKRDDDTYDPLVLASTVESVGYNSRKKNSLAYP